MGFKSCDLYRNMPEGWLSQKFYDSSDHNKTFIFVTDNIFAFHTICHAGRDLEKKKCTLLHTKHEVRMPYLASRFKGHI